MSIPTHTPNARSNVVPFSGTPDLPQSPETKFKADIHSLERVSNGDQTAMKEIYELYSGPLFHFARTWLGNEHEALDVVHETMLEVWNRAERYQGRSSAKSWIFSIARFKAIDKNRKFSRMLYTDVEPEILDETDNPFDMLSVSQSSEKIRICVSELSESHRRAVHLAFYQDLSYKEIAEIENCPVGTIKTRILHAKKLLKRALSEK